MLYAREIINPKNSLERSNVLLAQFLSEGHNIDMPFGFRRETLLHMAVRRHDKERVKMLVGQNASIKEPDRFNRTPFDLAEKCIKDTNSAEVVVLLRLELEKNGDVSKL